MNREQRIKELEDRMEKMRAELEEVKAQPPKDVWTLSKGDTIYIVSSHCHAVPFTWTGSELARKWRDHGMLYLIQQEAERFIEYQRALTRVKRRIAELNDGWTPVWGGEDQMKYYVYCENSRYFVLLTKSNTYFKHTNNDMYLKSETLAQQLIKEMPDDLKIILTY
jgi:hypothetical protein